MPRMMCTPGTEVIGQVMLSYIDNLRAEEIRPLLEKYGVANINPNEWYPLETWLALINEMSADANFASNMIAVGLKVAEYAIMPPEMKNVSLAQMLEGWNVHFHANHRNGEIGQITTEKISDTHYRLIHQHIYPDDLNYGLAYGFARTFLPKGTHFTVAYEDYEHRLDNGGADKTVINVKWEAPSV